MYPLQAHGPIKQNRLKDQGPIKQNRLKEARDHMKGPCN